MAGDAVYGVLLGHEDDPGPSVLALENPVQTNEPGRCVALLGGFLEWLG